MDSPFVGSQFIVEQKILSIRDTLSIKDRNGKLLSYVKEKYLSWGPQFWFEAPEGSRWGEIHGKVLTIRPTFEIYNPQGQLIAVVKKKLLKIIGSEWWMENASGTEIAKIHGNILSHDYVIQTPDGKVISQIHKKWVTVRDSYCVEIQNTTLDSYLILSFVISLDESFEYHHHNVGSHF